MEKAIALFAELGRRLGTFGRDKTSRRIIRRAEQENGWFTEPEIRRAVEALRSEMLDQVRLRAWLAPYRVPVAVPRDVLVIMAATFRWSVSSTCCAWWPPGIAAWSSPRRKTAC